MKQDLESLIYRRHTKHKTAFRHNCLTFKIIVLRLMGRVRSQNIPGNTSDVIKLFMRPIRSGGGETSDGRGEGNKGTTTSRVIETEFWSVSGTRGVCVCVVKHYAKTKTISKFWDKMLPHLGFGSHVHHWD